MNQPNIQQIETKQDFIHFLEFFLEDYMKNQDQWENRSLKEFLEAMIAYTNDIQGYYDNTEKNTDSAIATWKRFADILKGAAIYE